jgi:FAD/FMN-containing dehydrogenase/Fe-S oxidoreductase
MLRKVLILHLLMEIKESLTNLKLQLEGEVFSDSMMRAMYATDASIYRELPLAVAYPKNESDLQYLITFANENATTLIPRTAGTSLAGQCVGNGLVVDVSKHFTQILELNVAEKWVRVQPGVIRDELNAFLKPHGLLFGPETSTANRAMIGGMVGNNSTGSNSIVYGNTRDHVLALTCLLSDGSKVEFSELSKEGFRDKLNLHTLEGALYRQIFESLQKQEVQENIAANFPKPNIHRRNTGYALDVLLENSVFGDHDAPFNFCKLLSGSEGTLALITEIKLNLLDLPPAKTLLLCPHFNSIEAAMKAVQKIMPYQPYACELMDKIIMDCTKEHIEYSKYRFFVEGDPKAILIVELRLENSEQLERQCAAIIRDLSENDLAFAYPKVYPPDTTKVWNLRKAGLGLLANIPGAKKAIALIEDTAVTIEDLPNYIADFTEMLAKHGQDAVYYAHAGAGEIHLRPILDLKKSEDVALMKAIAWDTAHLVKKYKGSLSGEHGDGRVRASFIPFMLGEKNYALLKEVKQTWDAQNIFNAGKIIDAPPIEQDLRYDADVPNPNLSTLLNFDGEGGILYLAEKCNGSGDCRKTHLSGGTMCPSYMASKNEKDTTRARANVLREFLTRNLNEETKWSSPEIKEALDLCLSCKACKSECPSNVDMAALKAEFTYQYQKRNGTPFRAKLFGHVAQLNALGSKLPTFSNWVNGLSVTKKMMGLAPERTAPKLAPETLKKWFAKRTKQNGGDVKNGMIYLFADEFTNFYDVEVGKKAILLLEKMSYEVKLAPISDSGRAYISKGMLGDAQKVAQANMKALEHVISEKHPLIGIEPSAILSFRDEYKRLIPIETYERSGLEKHSFTIEEFLAKEMKAGKIEKTLFNETHTQVKLHGHCHQKALSEVKFTQEILMLPKNYHVEVLPTGCCGMAGSFGYEKEHYELSMQVGELVLFPAVRKSAENEIICAVGTSCRHQIFDGTQRTSYHPIEVLYDALLEK